MKKAIILIWILSCMALIGRAQGTASYFSLCSDAQSNRVKMTVTAILDLSKTDYYYWGNSPRYQVAAFIEGECHAIASEGENSDSGYWDEREDYYNWFVLKIPYSSARSGKPITFKMYNSSTGLEYTLKNDDNIRSIGINMGSDTNPIVLKAVEMTDMDFNNFTMKVNNMQDLSAKLTFSPNNATCPNNLEFRISPNTYTLNVTGNAGYQFTPSAAGTYEVLGYAGNAGIRFRDGEITVEKATNYVSGLSINSGYETIDVSKGDADMLGDELARALNVSYYYPSESPDEYPVWESSNTSIVGPDATGKLIPKKSGTCTLTAKVFNTLGNASSGVRKSASLTVNVHQYVTGITMNYTSLNCIIGDDLTDYLPRTFQIQPSDADNKTVTYTILRGEGILQKRSDGHIVAIGAGTATIQISSSDPGYYSGSLSVTVNNVYNDISINQSSLNIKYNGAGSAQDITDVVTANYSYLPEGGIFMGEYPTVTSNNPSVVKVDQEQTATGVGTGITVTALGTGTATITVTMQVPNLIEMSLGNWSAAGKTVTKSFTVVMTQGAPSAISLPSAIQVKYGETLDLKTKITLTPSNAEFDYSKLVWTCSESNWTDFFTITNNVLTTKKPSRNSFHLTASVTGSTLTASTVVTIPNPATGLTVKSGYETITVFTDGHTELNQKLKAAFVVTPENTTDYIEYVIADQTVISEERDEFFIENPGTTTVTCRVYNYVNSEKKVLFEKSVTVIVKVKLQSFSFKDREYSLNVGQTLDLKKELQLSPANADIDLSQIVWAVEDNTKAKVENGVLTALAPTAPDYFEVTATLGSIKASTILYIYQPATGIQVNSGYSTLTINVGENTKLNDFLNKAITLSPANTTDHYYWHIADESIISYDDDLNCYVAKKAGTTKATAYVGDWATATLKTDVTITVLPLPDGLSMPEQVIVKMGETLDLKTILTITPPTAAFDYSKVRWSWSTGMDSYLGITNNVLTPKKPYKGSITLTATVEGSDMTAQTRLYILQPATALTVKSGMEKIEVFVGQSTELTDAINQAFVVTPDNTTDVMVYTIEKEDVVENERDVTFTPLKAGTTKITATLYDLLDADTHRNPRFSKSVEVVVKVKLQSFSFKDREYSLNVGQTLDLKKELQLSPANADIDLSQIVWAVEDNTKAKVENGVLTALAPTAPDYFEVTATLGSIKASTILYIYQPATGIQVNSGYSTLTINVGENTKLNDFLNKAITLSPANTTDHYYWHIADESIISYDDDLNCYVAKKAGTTKATAYVGDWDEATLKADVTIVVMEKTTDVTAITIDGPATVAVGTAATFTVKPNAGATLSPSAVKVTESHQFAWPLVKVENTKLNNDGSVAVTVMPLAPGADRINVAYNALKAQKDVTVGVATTLTQGWQWMTLYSDSEKDPAKVFGSNIYEVRSQTDLLAYEDGDYYGTLTIEAGKGYMVRASKNVAADKAFLQTDGKVVTQSQPLNLYNGWTWMGYPYVHAYTPAELKLLPTEGDRIVSKTGGFVEYADGAWTGTLTKLNPYEAYLYYNHKGADNSLTWQPESALYPGSSAATARETLRAAEQTFTLSYDPSPYRTNMTMVAEVNEQSTMNNEHWTIGAFVGNECRGEGRLVNGLFFITVHANDGERVTFRLIDTDTNFEYTLNETVIVTRMLGTVKQPYQLTVDTQGIVASPDPSEEGESETYDLLGRKQSPSFRGVRGGFLLQRQADGQVKKVVVRNK